MSALELFLRHAVQTFYMALHVFCPTWPFHLLPPALKSHAYLFFLGECSASCWSQRFRDFIWALVHPMLLLKLPRPHPDLDTSQFNPLGFHPFPQSEDWQHHASPGPQPLSSQPAPCLLLCAVMQAISPLMSASCHSSTSHSLCPFISHKTSSWIGFCLPEWLCLYACTRVFLRWNSSLS